MKVKKIPQGLPCGASFPAFLFPTIPSGNKKGPDFPQKENPARFSAPDARYGRLYFLQSTGYRLSCQRIFGKKVMMAGAVKLPLQRGFDFFRDRGDNMIIKTQEAARCLKRKKPIMKAI